MRFPVELPDVRAEDWRKNTALLESARRITSDIAFQQMLAVLRTESPANVSFPSTDASPVERSHWQSLTEGYHRAINTLLSLSVPITSTATDAEEDYGSTTDDQ